MSIIGSELLLASAAATGYQVERSLRFNSSDFSSCSRVFSSAGNRKTWTWAGWVKRSALSTNQNIFGTNSATGLYFTFQPDNTFVVQDYTGSVQNYALFTTQVFRDPSAWLHILFALDTTQATASNRIKLYINGVQVTSFSTQINPSLNYDGVVNTATTHTLGRLDGQYYFDGYLADVHFIDGQALTPSSFTETSATTGQLIPKAYTGSFGTNGFWLKFSDNSNNTATTLGKDYSGNSNNWSPSNLLVTAGINNDSLVDTPTSYGTDTGAGGEVRGNYCTWNPLTASITGATLSNGNLDLQTPVTNYGLTHGTIGVSSGKWYWEIRINSLGDALIGIDSRSVSASNLYLGAGISYSYTNSGTKYGPNDASASYGATYTSNDVIGVALDLDAGTLSFYKNGTSQGQAFSGIAGTFVPAFSDGSASTVAGANVTANFGQRQWAYAAPAGFKALCDQNLPAPVVAKPSSAFDVKLYTGNGTYPNNVTGFEFSPSLVWIKDRSAARSNALFDQVRGTQRLLQSDLTDAEATLTTGLYTFNSNGFTLGTRAQLNTLNESFVAWAWDAGSSTVTNTQGSITSQVRANASAGFSIVTYTGNGTSGGTIGHGLGAAPRIYIVKRRDSATNWVVFTTLIDGSVDYLFLNDSAAKGDLGIAAPTSTVASLTSGGDNNANGGTYVAYCFAPVAGYSSFGSYVGNGGSNGPFVYTGFRPKFVLIKGSSFVSNWNLLDGVRDSYNVADKILRPNLSNAELNSISAGSGFAADFLSNGFKLRASLGDSNSNAETFVWAAFAESPFAYSRAR